MPRTVDRNTSYDRAVDEIQEDSFAERQRWEAANRQSKAEERAAWEAGRSITAGLLSRPDPLAPSPRRQFARVHSPSATATYSNPPRGHSPASQRWVESTTSPGVGPRPSRPTRSLRLSSGPSPTRSARTLESRPPPPSPRDTVATRTPPRTTYGSTVEPEHVRPSARHSPAAAEDPVRSVDAAERQLWQAEQRRISAEQELSEVHTEAEISVRAAQARQAAAEEDTARVRLEAAEECARLRASVEQELQQQREASDAAARAAQQELDQLEAKYKEGLEWAHDRAHHDIVAAQEETRLSQTTSRDVSVRADEASAAYRADLSEAKSAHAQETAQLRGAHSEETLRVQTTMQAMEIRILEADRERMAAQLRSSELSATLKEEQEQHDAQMGSLEEELDAAIAAHKAEAEALAKQAQSVQEQLKQELAYATAKADEGQQRMQDAERAMRRSEKQAAAAVAKNDTEMALRPKLIEAHVDAVRRRATSTH